MDYQGWCGLSGSGVVYNGCSGLPRVEQLINGWINSSGM